MTEILVVDDESDVRQTLGEILESAGYHPVPAESAAQALEAIARRAPDAILLDLLMPGMDGFDFVHELVQRGLAGGVPIIVLTAVDCMFSQPELFSALPGVRAILTKPFGVSTLVECLDSILDHDAAAVRVSS
ncbi:MAG: response regulator [Planctomycetes bacterium]|nr:response regulator [Planctomycetota bacterium]